MESKSVKEEEVQNHNNSNPYKLLDLIPNNREWQLPNKISTVKNPRGRSSDDNKLELRLGLGLGLPGCHKQETTQEEEQKKWLLNHQHHSHSHMTHNNYCNSCKNISCNCRRGEAQDHKNPHLPQQRSFPAAPPWAGSSKDRLLPDIKNQHRTGFPPRPSPHTPANNNTTTATPLPPSNISQKRAAPGPVVGWPPIRSFRKNLATTSNNTTITANNAKQPENQNGYHPSSSSSRPAAAIEKRKTPTETTQKGQFVKINMDGVAIGRKVNLSNFDNYEKLSFSVDDLFRGLLAAQSNGGIQKKDGEEQGGKPITGLLDGKGEYTLVYEDNEGDRMLVGDVPWHMFLSTVKRLRVLKSSELLKLNKANNNCKEGNKVATESLTEAR